MLRAVPTGQRSGEGGNGDSAEAYPSAAAGDRVFVHGRLRLALQVICVIFFYYDDRLYYNLRTQRIRTGVFFFALCECESPRFEHIYIV